MTSQTFFQNSFVLAECRRTNFAGIIKIKQHQLNNTFLKQPLKSQTKLKELEIIY